MHVEVVVGVEREGLEASAANTVRDCRAARLSSGAVGILMNPVIGAGQLEVWDDGVANAGPIDLHVFRSAVGIVVDESQNVTADVGVPGAQRRLWIRILDVLEATEEFKRV